MNYNVSFFFFVLFVSLCLLSLSLCLPVRSTHLTSRPIGHLQTSVTARTSTPSRCLQVRLASSQSDTQTEPKVKINIKIRGMIQKNLDRLTYRDEHKQLNDTHYIKWANIEYLISLYLLCISVQKMQRRWPGSSSPSPTASCPMRRWASTRLAVTQCSSCRRVIYLCSSSSVCRCLKWWRRWSSWWTWRRSTPR